MKPRFEPRDEEFDTLLSKAKEVEDRIAKGLHNLNIKQQRALK